MIGYGWRMIKWIFEYRLWIESYLTSDSKEFMHFEELYCTLVWLCIELEIMISLCDLFGKTDVAFGSFIIWVPC